MTFQVKAKVEIFPQKGGWHFIKVPKSITKTLSSKQDRGLIPILAKLNKTTWKTSLLPMGDGTHFIALSKVVREKENIKLKDTISVSFTVRTSFH